MSRLCAGILVVLAGASAAQGVDFAAALRHARTQGGAALRAMNFAFAA